MGIAATMIITMLSKHMGKASGVRISHDSRCFLTLRLECQLELTA
jgi:hypothetical protein